MQQLFGVGIGCPATSWKKPFRVAFAKHSAETCVVSAAADNNTTTQPKTNEGNSSPFTMVVFLPGLQAG